MDDIALNNVVMKRTDDRLAYLQHHLAKLIATE